MASGKIDSGHRHELLYAPAPEAGMLTNVEASFFLLFPFSPVRRDDDEESTTTIIIIIISIIISIRNGVAIGKTAARARRDD